MDEHGMRTLLHDLADAEIPAARVDLDRAMAAGSRQRKRRVMGAAGSVLAVAAAVGAFVAVTITASPQATVRPQARATATPSSTPTRPATMPARALDRFDPLVPYASFGWLPAGYTAGQQGNGSMSTTGSVQRTAATASGSEQFVLTVDAGHACSGSVRTSLTCAGTNDTTLSMHSFRPAPAVNGRPAYWAVDSAVGGYLVWQYAPGAWASLHIWGSVSPQAPPVADRAMLGRVAERVRYDAGVPLAFPFWVRLPAGWTVAQTSFVPGPSGGLLSGWMLAGPPADPELADLAVWTPVPGTCKGTPNATLDGVPATVQHSAGLQQSVCAENVGGLSVSVSLYGAGPDLSTPVPGTARLGGALGLAKDLHLLGGRTGGWTKDPLR